MKKTSKSKATNKKLNSNYFGTNKFHLILLFCISFIVYANTLSHEYTQDDAIVIYDNMFTTKGISGIPGLLTNDTFYGFFKEKGKAKLVSGGRYRPFTPVMFAVERQVFGKNPFWGHLFNVLWFSFLVVLLYKVLEKLLLFERENTVQRSIILLACLIFAVHPIHTEAVANIKGRDEIMSLVGALLSLYFLLKAYDLKVKKHAVYAGVFAFLALMSKENSITFLAIIPLSFVFFRKTTWSQAFKSSKAFIIGTVLFLIARTAVLGLDFGEKSMELMNNPFLKIVGGRYESFSFVEWISTVMFTLLKYIQLLVFPHPLTHDYYPRQIEIMNLGDWLVWMSFLVYAVMVFIMFKLWKKNKIISWSIFYFIATLSIVSNIVFPIGTNMSERFMFMPSIGFVLIVAYFIFKLPKKAAYGISIIILLFFSVKTFTRNLVWKNDFTLFTTDVKTSTRSAKMLNAAGGALSTEAVKEKNETKKIKMLRKSIGYLNTAVEIHPNYKTAYLIRANDFFYLGELDNAISNYEQALRVDPNFKDAKKNIAIALRDRARMYGEKENNLQKALEYLKRSYDINNTDIETIRLLGISYGMGGNHKEAIKYFKRISVLKPDNAMSFVNLSSAYHQAGMEKEATETNNTALKLDPKIYEKLRN